MATESTLLTSFAEAQEFLRAYREEIVQAKMLGKPVVWHAMTLPPDLLAGYDVVPIAGEWYAAASGPSRGVELLETIEDCGLPHDLCSYSRICLGSMVAKQGFLGEFPEPDVVIGVEGMCNTEANWYEFIARYYNVPFFTMDYTPMYVCNFPAREEAPQDALRYFVEQAYRFIDFMEQTTGQRVDEEKLINAVITHHRNDEIWNEIKELWHAVPSPVRFRNLLTYLPARMALACRSEGTQVALAFRDELAQRVKDGVSGIANERIRLLWSAPPPWYHMGLLGYLDRKGAAIVAGSYFEHLTPWLERWSEPRNINDCLWQLGQARFVYHSYSYLKHFVDETIEAAREARVDGLVLHSNRSCRKGSKGHLDVRLAVKKTLGLPTMVFESSPSDPRDYSPAAVEHALNTFLEQVVTDKERRVGNA